MSSESIFDDDSPPEAPSDLDAQAAARFHAAWLAHTRQELEAPALAVREFIHLLAADPAGDLPPRVRQDLGKLAEYGDRLADRVRRLLESAPAQEETDPRRLDEARRTIRHDLRSPAGYIVSLCDTILEDYPPGLLSADRVEQVRRIRERAGRFIERIESLVQAAGHSGRIPLADELRQTLKRLSSLPAVQPTLTGRVLLVDDSADNRELYAALLAAQGHTVTTAPDGESALEELERLGVEGVDLVLLDVLMPGISGLEVLDRIKAQPRLRHLPVVLMSALTEEEVLVNSLVRGAEDFLRRPVSAAHLRARLGGCLEKKRLHDRERGYQQRIDELLLALFPQAVAAELKDKGSVQTRRHERVGVMFLDVVGFTRWCEEHKDSPESVVDLLRRFVRTLERSARRHHVQKIKTIGDAFMATAGLLVDDPEPAGTLVRCAADMIRSLAVEVPGWMVRAGIHLGPVVAGIVGETQFSYDIWGDTVNMAARVESSGRAGYVSLSSPAWESIEGQFPAHPRDVALRGIGPVVVWDIDPSALG